MYRNRFRRKYRFRRNFKRRRSNFRRQTFGKRVKRTLYKIAETKYVDTAFVGQSLQSANDMFVFDPFANITVGTQKLDRIGNKIHCTWINMRYSFDANNVEGIYIRMGLVRWKGVAGNPDRSLLPPDHRQFIDPELWSVVRDTVHNLGNTDTNGRDKVFRNIWIRINRDIVYDSGTTQIYQKPFIFFVNSNDAVVPSPTGDFYFRVYFKDI